MAIRISSSMLGDFQDCPYKFYLGYLTEPRVVPPVPIRTVFGSALHYVLNRVFYRELSPRAKKKRIEKGLPLVFPLTKKSIIGIWINVWRQTLAEENANKAIAPFARKIRYGGKTESEIKEEQDFYLHWGIQIVARYWEINAEQPLPVATEKYFIVPAPHRNDVFLTGFIDQIRKNDEGYWLVDLKTEIGPKTFSWEDQYYFHNNSQFTIYSLGFRKIFGEKEAGIIIYPLSAQKKDSLTGEIKDKEAIVTFRDEKNFKDLAELLDFFLACINREVFPKYFGKHCRFCNFIEICDQKRIFTKPLSLAEKRFKKIEIKETEISAIDKEFKKLRLKF